MSCTHGHPVGGEQASHDEWLGKTVEAPLQSSRAIVDPHHHLWTNHRTRRSVATYMLDEILADVRGSGHNVVSTCYMQSSSAGWRRGPPGSWDECVGESEVAQGAAAMAESTAAVDGGPRVLVCAGIISSVPMAMQLKGAGDDGVDYARVLQAHVRAARNFKGVRLCGGKAETIPFKSKGFGEVRPPSCCACVC